MANQMIALGARGPQLPDLGSIAQRYGGIMNAMRQQRTAEMQVGQRQQEMEIARNQEQRAVEQHQIEQARRQMDTYTVLAGQTMNAAGYNQFLSRLDRDAPEIAAQFRTNLPPDQFNRDALLQMVGGIADNFKTRFGPLEHEVVQDANGRYYVAQTGGTQPSGLFELPGFRLAPGGAGGGVGGPDPEQRDPAAAPTGLNAQPGETPGQMMDRGIPAENIPMGSPTPGLTPAPATETLGLTPASAGGMAAPTEFTLETAPQIIQDAVQNRVIGQANFEQLRNMVGPEHDRALAAWMQQNQIRIQPTGEAAAPGMRSAEYRVGEGAPAQFQQVQNAPAGTVYAPTGGGVQGRNPTVSPSQNPDIAGQVARAQRPPPAEAGAVAGATTRAERQAEADTIYERTRRERQGQNDAAFVETYPSSSATVRDGLNVLNRLIGDATVVNGSVVVPRRNGRPGRAPHRGFEGLIGVGIPGLRFLPGSPQADADALFEQVQGRAFLEAFETLKGGGAITEAEGRAATQAISRLGRNISEAEFVTAANELRGIMRNALARADRRASRLGIPSTAPATPAATRPAATARRGAATPPPAPTRTRRGTPIGGVEIDY